MTNHAGTSRLGIEDLFRLAEKNDPHCKIGTESEETMRNSRWHEDQVSSGDRTDVAIHIEIGVAGRNGINLVTIMPILSVGNPRRPVFNQATRLFENDQPVGLLPRGEPSGPLAPYGKVSCRLNRGYASLPL